MGQKLREHYARLWNDPPGKRFIEHYRRRQQEEREHPWKAALYIALGSMLVVIGVIFALLPVLPGFVLIVPGLGLLSARVRIVARSLDQAELFIRQSRHHSRQDRSLV
jgi:hypothetical protein